MKLTKSLAGKVFVKKKRKKVKAKLGQKVYRGQGRR